MDRDQLNSSGRSALEFAKMALGVTPVIAAAYYGIGRVRANEAVNNPLAVLMGSNAHHELGGALGSTAKRLTAAARKEEEQKFKTSQHKIRMQVEKSDAIHELFKSVDQKNATLQALAVTLDDPAMGLNETQRTAMKRTLLEAGGTHTTVDQEKVVTEILKAIQDSGSEDVSRNYIRSLHSFQRVGGSLGVPTGAIPTRGVSYNPVIKAFDKEDATYLDKIQKEIHGLVGSGHRVEIQEYEEIGTRYRAAKIYGTLGSRDNLLATLPLHALDDKGNRFSPSFFRSGESFRTRMTMPAQMVDAHSVWNIGSRVGTDDIGRFGAAVAQEAVVDTPTWAIGRLRRFATAPGHREWSNLRAEVASIMSDVGRASSTGTAFGAHARFQAAATRTVGVYNFEKLNAKQQQQAMAWAGSSMPGTYHMGLSNSSMLHRSDLGTAGAMGVHQGSYYAALQNTFQFDIPTATGTRQAIGRDMIPLSMREFQVTGRPAAFVGEAYRVGGHVYGSLLTEASRLAGAVAGSDIAAYDRTLEAAYNSMTPFGTTISGAQLSPTVIDFRGRMQRDTGGEGLSYIGGKHKIRTAHQFGILDPESHGYLQSDVIKRLRAEGDKGLTLNRDELRELQYLGETSNGSKFLPFNEDMQSAHIRLAEVTHDPVAGGSRRTVSLIQDLDSEVSILKSFGLYHKGTDVVREHVLGVLDAKAERYSRRVLGKLGFQESNVHLVNSDMFKKGAASQFDYLRSSALMHGNIDHSAIAKLAGEIASNTNRHLLKMPNASKAVQTDYTALAHYAQATMELMHKSGAGPEEIGTVMTGVFWGAEGKSANYGLDRNSIMQLAKSLWKNDRSKMSLFGQAISTGIGIAGGHRQIGPGPRDWGQARGSIEPRFVKTLNERFRGMGMTSAKSAEFVSGVVKNKIGLAEHYSLATQLLKMQVSLHGGQSPLDAFGSRSGNRMGFKELFGKVLSGSKDSETALFDYLKTQEHGVTFHLDDIKEESPGLHRVFKEMTGQGEIRLPGREAIEASRGALIKQEGGSVAVEGRLAEVINSFQRRMLDAKNNPNTENALRSLTAWKGDATKLFTEVYDQLHSGKVKGSTSPSASRYFLNEGSNFSTKGGGPGGAMHKRALENYMRGQKNGAMPVHLDAEGFLSLMADMPQEGTAKATSRDLRKKAEMFFLGMEEGGSRKGIISLGARHPEVGPAHVFLTQIFRHLEEVESLGGKDAVFQMIKDSKIGKELLEQNFYTVARDPVTGKETAARVPMNIQKFADMNTGVEVNGVYHVPTDRQRQKFFKEFVENIREFTGGKNAGVAHYPMMRTNVGNFGAGAGSWLDVDGDRTNIFLFNGKHSGELVKHLDAVNEHGVTNAMAYAQGDAELKFFHNKMQKETRQAIANMVDKSLANGTPSVQAQQIIGIGNETNVSMNTGPLDVNLKGMHDALGNNIGGQATELTSRRSAFGRDVLAHIEENFIIKSKHIPTEINFAEDISKAARIAMKTGEMSEFRSVLKRVFHGTDFGGAGIHVQGQVTASGTGPEADTLTAMLRSSMPNEGRYDFHYNIDHFLDDLTPSVKRAVSESAGQYDTSGRIVQGLRGDNAVALEVLNALRGGQSLSAGAIEGFMGKSQGARTELAVDAMREGAMKIGNHMMAPMALGVLGAVTVAGMMGGGLAPEPIIMPGEIPSGSMSAGSLFNRRDPQVDPGSLGQQGSQYDTMPGMMGETYAVRPNSYQIRGEVSSGSGLATFGSYFNQLSGGSGRGQITINDQRRPITRNYVDRLMGE